MRHKLLARQIKKHLEDSAKDDPKLMGILEDFLKAVDVAYTDMDEGRNLIERSMEISSKELLITNQELRARHEELQAAHELAQRQHASVVTNAKMSELGKMAGGIAHEINTPLSTILLLSEGLLKNAENNAELEDIGKIERVIATVKRIAKIVKGLRTFSRDGSNDPFNPCDSTQIIDHTLAMCSERFKYAEIELQLDIGKGISFMCRETQISQLLLNLLNNAYDAIHTIPIRWVKLQVRDLDSHIEISVTDSGPGIPAELQDKIAVPFFTTKGVGEGTGLGLSISMGIARAHGGELTLDKTAANTRIVILLAKDPEGCAIQKVS